MQEPAVVSRFRTNGTSPLPENHTRAIASPTGQLIEAGPRG